MRQKNIIILLACCLMAFGVYGLAHIKKNEFPAFTIRQGVVVAVYPGATVYEVEEQLTKPLEDYIFTFKEVNKAKTRSVSRHGLSIVQVELNADFADKELFWSKFKHGVSTFKSSLPRGVLAVIVNDDFGDASDLLLTLSSTTSDYRALHDQLRRLQDRLRSVESVGRMRIVGEQHEQITVELNPTRLAHSGLSYEAIATTLLAQGFATSGGELQTPTSNLPIFVASPLRAEQEVANTLLYDGSVRLADIATITRAYPAPTSYVTLNGERCLVLSVEMKPGRSITDMGAAIDVILHDFESSLPSDFHLPTMTTPAAVVRASVVDFLKELLIAILAVTIVVLLLLPLRVALVAASTIPITIFISLGLFYAFGIELNTVTLAALIVTLGMIVDNSIVIIDNYIELISEQPPTLALAYSSARHFFRSILTATLAISGTFCPLLLTTDGTFRDFLTMFPWATTIVLLVSLAVAEWLVPIMMYQFIKVAPSTTTNSNSKPSALERAGGKAISYAFAHPRRTLTLGALTLLISALLFHFIPLRLMPTAERNQFAVEIYLPTGTPLARTATVADSLERVLLRDERVLTVAAFKGMASPRFQTGYAPQISGENYAQFIVNCRDDRATEQVLDHYAPLWHDALPGVHIRFKQLAYGMEENPIEIRLTGNTLEALQQRADSLVTILAERHPELWLLRIDSGDPQPTIAVNLDPLRADRLHVTRATTALALAQQYSRQGLTVGSVWEGDHQIPITLRSTAPHDNHFTLPLLHHGDATTNSYGSAYLAQHPGQIPHRNGELTLTIKADVARGTNVTALTKQLQRELPHPDPTLTFGGEIENNHDNLPKILRGIAIAIAVIFLLLLAHYRRLTTPTLLLLSLVLVLPGTALGVLLQRVDFSLTCFLGIISLMGILVRNAIIMFDYAQEIGDIRHAATRRARPIILTSCAAAIGVVPMLLSGSALWQPMAAVICYGTLITMLLILTILPLIYKYTIKQ